MDAQGAFSAILAVESSAKQLASRVSCLLESLKCNLTTASNCSRECIDLYHASVSQTCCEADASIRLMYSTMAQCEELTKAMSEVPKLMEDLARVKDTLQQIENFLLP
nr:unnamed protein product [Spirometra erinaceieuropaei]